MSLAVDRSGLLILPSKVHLRCVRVRYHVRQTYSLQVPHAELVKSCRSGNAFFVFAPTHRAAQNITVPSSMFSKVVPAFTSQDISALGPLMLIAVIYRVLGVAHAWMTKQFFWIPHRFRYHTFLVCIGSL
ncbi:hypothetical protein DFH07DRAFT_292037 [Mycena maculata]|uniref:Uncharacterized protein n=1 Tax=Mycena maculata TaxID=230809 RepID=A0AAD7NPN2_9AGAR|nr:hypothetical protein DFH07DRAFT_292037 [Mycena maculata]